MTRPVVDAGLRQRLAGHDPTSLLGVLHSRSGTKWRAEMIPGSWSADPLGNFMGGALGVLVDVALSIPLLVQAPEDRAPITTSLSVDFVVARYPMGGVLRATAELIHADNSAGLVRGEIRDQAGRVVAAATLTGRLGERPAGLPKDRPPGELRTDPTLCLFDIVPGVVPSAVTGVVSLQFAPASWTANLRGYVHGGMLLALSDVLASGTLPGGAAEWGLETVRINYLRPVVVGQPCEATAVRLRAGATQANCHFEFRLADGRHCVSAELGYVRRPRSSGGPLQCTPRGD